MTTEGTSWLTSGSEADIAYNKIPKSPVVGELKEEGEQE